MAIERERKFLLIRENLPRSLGRGKIIQTGYFTKDSVAIRVSIKNLGGEDEKSKICFKSPGTEERQEFEYTIPTEDAKALLVLAPTFLSKTRWDREGWEIDRFDLPTDTELWVAEWEEREGKGPIPNPLPDWIGQEVTEQPELYSNQALAWKYGRK